MVHVCDKGGRVGWCVCVIKGGEDGGGQVSERRHDSMCGWSEREEGEGEEGEGEEGTERVKEQRVSG